MVFKSREGKQPMSVSSFRTSTHLPCNAENMSTVGPSSRPQSCCATSLISTNILFAMSHLSFISGEAHAKTSPFNVTSKIILPFLYASLNSNMQLGLFWYRSSAHTSTTELFSNPSDIDSCRSYAMRYSSYQTLYPDFTNKS